MQELIGHFHPVLVHLPIGILVIAVVLQWLSRKEKYASIQNVLPVVWFWGMIGAILSCISGFLLSRTDDYDPGLVSWHQWLAIATTVFSIIAWLSSRSSGSKLLSPLSIVIILLLIIVGHLGGSLTHGSDYLSRPLANVFGKGDDGGEARKPIPNVQEALVYNDVVKPILQSRCYSCHGSNKQKGKLRLDEPEFISKGGKNGEVIVNGNTDESELMKRLMLPKDHEDHMPPKEKPQLTENDIALLHWWISNGADYTKKVKEYPQTEKIKPVLLAMQSGVFTEENKITAVPAAPVEQGDTAAINELKNSGVVVLPVAQLSNYLAVNFVTAEAVSEKQLQQLDLLKKQIVWLKLGDTKIDDKGLDIISRLTNLTRLYLDNTAVTDEGIKKLQALAQLQFLNLVGTKVTANGVISLKGLKNLNQIYLYRTDAKKDFIAIKKEFPKAFIDTGGYTVATLQSDTTEVKPAKTN